MRISTDWIERHDMIKLPRIGSAVVQFVKYSIVGISNTLLTLGIIFVSMYVFRLSLQVSNILGYSAGLINSFIWNRRWTFRSTGRVRREMVLFFLVWLFCFLLQYGIINLLEHYDVLSPPLIQLSGNVVFTTLSFTANKFITFKPAKSG
jgi:putative flippase GtrA